MKTFILIFALLATSFTQDATTTVTLAWDANSEPDIAGYRISVFPAEGGVGQSYEVTGTQQAFVLTAGHYIAYVTAINTAGLESDATELAFEVTATLRLTIQRSTDLRTWTDVYSQVVPMVYPLGFYRLKLSAQ